MKSKNRAPGQQSYEEMIQFLITNYSFYSYCADGSQLEDHLHFDDSAQPLET